MSLSFAMRGNNSPEVLSGAGGDPRDSRSAPQGVADLRTAIWSNQLTVHYQPQIELPGGSLIGVEALVRWHHPRFGVLAPADLLPLAEQSGLMAALTTSVLATAAAQATVWWHEGYELTMAVNIAPTAIGPTLVQDVTRVVETCGLPPGTLRLELTEDLSPEDLDRVRPTLNRLARPRRRPLGRRLRHGLLVTGHRAGVAGRRDQDRPVVHPADALRLAHAGHRAIDDRPLREAGDPVRRRGHRGRGDPEPVARHGL